MTEESSDPQKPIYKRTWFIVVVVIAVMGFFGALLDDGEDVSGAASSTTEAAVIPTTEVEATPTTQQPTTSQSPDPTDAPVTTTTVVLSDGFMILEIVVFDWTENIPYGQIGPVAVGVGFESWEPEMEFGGDFKEFGEYEIGVPSSFEFYPDGYGGSQIIVDFVMTDEMISGSTMSQTHVEIYDNEVLAWGQAIPGFEQTFDR